MKNNTIDKNIIDSLKDDLVNIGKKLYNKNMVSATGGNISVIVPGTHTVLIKKSGICLGDICNNNFLLIDLNGKVLEGKGKPSKEYRFHVGIYKKRPDIGAIIHAHSPFIIALSLISKTFPLLTLQSKSYINKVQKVEKLLPGSKRLADKIVHLFSDTSLGAVLMEGHGYTIVGENIKKTFYLAEILEDAAKVAYLVKLFPKIQTNVHII